MMKKLVVLFIAVAALFAFSACEPYAVTLDETGSVELDDVGIRNYNLSGKTLVNETYEYIYKEVEVQVFNNETGDVTSTTRTTTKIPEIAYTETYTFAADDTYTYTYAKTYLAGADGDYRDTSVTTSTAATTTITTTRYSGSDYNVWSYDAVLAGRAGKTIYTSSSAGTWERITRQDSYSDPNTWKYYVTETSSSSSSTSLVPAYPNDAPVIEGAPGNTNKVTYSAGDTTNYVDAPSDEPSPISDVYWVRDDADGNDIVRLFGKNYTVQP
jgi:hypothetical protein